MENQNSNVSNEAQKPDFGVGDVSGSVLSVEEFAKFHFKNIDTATEWFPVIVAISEGYSRYIQEKQKEKIEDAILMIRVEKSNFEYIAKSGIINGSLYQSIKQACYQVISCTDR